MHHLFPPKPMGKSWTYPLWVWVWVPLHHVGTEFQISNQIIPPPDQHIIALHAAILPVPGLLICLVLQDGCKSSSKTEMRSRLWLNQMMLSMSCIEPWSRCRCSLFLHWLDEVDDLSCFQYFWWEYVNYLHRWVTIKLCHIQYARQTINNAYMISCT